METEFAGLARAEKLAGPSDLQVGFSDFEAIGGPHHSFQPGARVVAQARWGDKNAMGLPGAAADASTQLVQLREAKAFGVLDDHDRGVRNVDADFDDCGGHENVDLIAAEFLHDLFFLYAGET